MKKTLANWDFSQYSDKTNLTELLAASHWQANASWLLPQLLALLSSKLVLAKAPHGWGFTPTLRDLGYPLDPKLTMLSYDNGMQVSKAAFQGMLNVLNHSPRGEILATGWKQNNGPGVRYCAAVPLFLSAFKEYRGIKYSEWDWTDPNRIHFLDKDNLEYSQNFNKFVEWSTANLLEIRDEGRTVRSGPKAGTQKPLVLTTTLTGIVDQEFKALPRLQKLALCQVWVYHPAVRHDLMITDHMNIDQHPEPLVGPEVDQVPVPASTSIWDV